MYHVYFNLLNLGKGLNSNKMKAIVHSKYGPTKVLQLNELPKHVQKTTNYFLGFLPDIAMALVRTAEAFQFVGKVIKREML